MKRYLIVGVFLLGLGIILSLNKNLPMIPISQIVTDYNTLKPVFDFVNGRIITYFPFQNLSVDFLKVTSLFVSKLSSNLNANNYNITNVGYLQANYIEFNKAKGSIDQVNITQANVNTLVVQNIQGLNINVPQVSGGLPMVVVNDNLTDIQRKVTFSKFMCMEDILSEYFGCNLSFIEGKAYCFYGKQYKYYDSWDQYAYGFYGLSKIIKVENCEKCPIASTVCSDCYFIGCLDTRDFKGRSCIITLNDTNLPDRDHDGMPASWIVPPDIITLGSDGKAVESLCGELKGEGGTLDDDKGTYHYTCDNVIYDSVSVKAYYSTGTTCLFARDNINFPETPYDLHNWMDDNWPSCDYCDFYTKIYLDLQAPESSLKVYLYVESDSGHWLWVNGKYIGKCPRDRAACHYCCPCTTIWDITQYIHSGQNEIWIWCTEGTGPEYCKFKVIVELPSGEIYEFTDWGSEIFALDSSKNLPDNDRDGIKEAWFVPPGKLMYSQDNYIIESLCEGLKGEGGTIGTVGYCKLEWGNCTYYTCNDLINGVDINGDGKPDYTVEDMGVNITQLYDRDKDGLKELSICPYINKMESDNSTILCVAAPSKVIYSKSNKMVEIGSYEEVDFSTPSEVDKWECFRWDYAGCLGIQNGKPLWVQDPEDSSNYVMEIYNNVVGSYKYADVKICFDLGKEVTIRKVIFDYKICNDVKLYVGTENNKIYVDDVWGGCKPWKRNEEKMINKRGRYFCFWLEDEDAYNKYTIYIDNVRLWIEP